MANRFRIPLLALAAAGLPAAAQVSESVTISTRAVPSVGGFATVPPARSPLQALSLGATELNEAGASSLADITKLDAGLTDAYNAEGYWSFLSARGFVLDNRSNYRRDGLPINAETAIGLANKERVELLKGTSGAQAGTSAPGGLVNLVVKRPGLRLRSAQLGWEQRGTVTAAVDLADRFGDAQQFGLRLNAAASALRPPTRSADGERQLFALAGDWQITPDSRLEAEVESSHQSQPSVPAFSLRGDALPAASQISPRTNLNNQPWSLPVVLDGDTASLRFVQRLSADWAITAHGASQRLRSDDRVAFPFGCYDAAADVYWADRYCPDGHFDLYDFRSEGERRRVDALDLRLGGSARTGAVTHEINAGLLVSRQRDRLPRSAFNFAGSGRNDASAVTPAAPDLTTEGVARNDRSSEWYLRDAMQLTPRWSLWAGMRHSRIDRDSVATDGSGAVAYAQTFTTPWLALAHQWTDATLLYASWGEGVETEVVPNRPWYANRGQPLAAMKSRQIEAGVKQATDALDWSLVAFRIARPQASDAGACDFSDDSCTRRIDGVARHQGIEAAIGARWGALSLRGSAMWLDAERQGAADASLNGLRPTNVPQRTVKAQAVYTLAARPGLSLRADLVHEGPRMALPDNRVEAPGWSRLDLGARWATSLSGVATVWQLAIDNAADARAWRETPYQFGHAYLFPLAPRTWRATVQASF